MRLTSFSALAILTVLAALCFAPAAHAGGAAKTPAVIAVVNTASWCPTCTENGPRAMKAFAAANKDGAVTFVMNDLSDETSSKASASKLAELGLTEATKELTGTGRVTFFHAKTKRQLGAISVAKADKELKNAVSSARKAAKSS